MSSSVYSQKAEKLRKVKAGAYQATLLGNQPYPLAASGMIRKTSGREALEHSIWEVLVFPLISMDRLDGFASSAILEDGSCTRGILNAIEWSLVTCKSVGPQLD